MNRKLPLRIMLISSISLKLALLFLFLSLMPERLVAPRAILTVFVLGAVAFQARIYWKYARRK